MIRLYDTATQEIRTLALRSPREVSIYCCGPTVYDVPHLGHGRAALVYDILRRYLTFAGLSVMFVSNVTDVDDKILARAALEGRDAAALAVDYERAWYDALAALGVARPDADPHATAWVGEMISLVADLVDRDIAYPTSRGVFFDVGRVPDYGLLAHQTLDSLRAGARVEADPEKRSAPDFALWKTVGAEEPGWDSPWGWGRPGWHTECVVMSLGLLGEGFDLHTGGLDLCFPHHENERAQAVALDRGFARHWMHHAFVEVGGQKMSKSLANFTSLTDLLDRADPRALRLLVLQSHYRSPMEVTASTIADSESALARLDNLARRAANLELSVTAPDEAVMDRFRAAMDNDLDTPAVAGLMFDLVRAANSALDSGERPGATVAALTQIAEVLGLSLQQATEGPDPPTLELVAQRDAARAAKDWATSDRLRSDLESAGWIVEDTPAGGRVHRRLQ